MQTLGHSTAALGQRVRGFRTASGLSQHELARRARISQSRISQIEAGQTAGPLPLRTLCDLADGLGVDLDALVDGDPVYHDVDLSEVRSPSRPLANMPRSNVSLVGRADDLAAVVGMVRADVRLLTLVGPGGVGKTRLAVHACRELANDFPRGTFFISLAACVDPGCVVATIARGVGLRKRDARPLRDRLLSDLPRGQILLVLDNVEQAVLAVAALAAELLAVYPGLALLVTSRSPLNIQGEQQHEVRPLACPDDLSTISVATAADSPAVVLFVQRVRERLPEFALTDANAPEIAAICKRLDGLPLAIELAAPRVRVYSPGQLLRRLDQRVTFLKAGSRDLPPRQQSLRASIEWSFHLLDSERRALLRRLAVFAGGFTLEAAVDVARGNVAIMSESVTILLEQHLITRCEHADGVPRFGMLETIHEYAREQLETAGEAAEFGGRHLSWCLSLAERSVPKMFTAEEPAWLDRLQQENANFETALGWAFGQGRETDLEDGLRLAGALADYWFLSGLLSEGREWLTRAVNLSADRAPSIGRARSLVGSCLIAQTRAAVDLAEAHGEQGLQMATSLDDQPTIGRALLYLGNLAMMRGDLDRARSLHEEALACFRRLGDRAWTALALLNLGMDFYRQGNLERAEVCARDALVIARAIGDRWDTIATLRLLGDVARDRRDLDQATALFAESLALGWRHGSEREAADSLSGMGTVAVASGDFERAARLLGAAETLYRRFEIDIPPPLRPDWPQVVASIRAGLTTDRFDRAWGSATPEQAMIEVIGNRPSGT